MATVGVKGLEKLSILLVASKTGSPSVDSIGNNKADAVVNLWLRLLKMVGCWLMKVPLQLLVCNILLLQLLYQLVGQFKFTRESRRLLPASDERVPQQGEFGRVSADARPRARRSSGVGQVGHRHGRADFTGFQL